MISAAHATVLRAEAGVSTPQDFDDVPSWQFSVWFSDLAPHCPDRFAPSLERRPANALNVEIGTPLLRCLQRSPDGRGLAWKASGGSVLAYGVCGGAQCPRSGGGK